MGNGPTIIDLGALQLGATIIRKPVAIVAHDPELVRLRDQYEEMATHYGQRREFLKKQLDDLFEEAKTKMAPLTDKATAHLVKNKMMPSEYNAKKHHIHFDDEGDVIYLCDGPI